MKEHRHPHPHRDPRQPRADARPGTNPPVFAWLPVDSASGYRLQVARDSGFEDICLDKGNLRDPLTTVRLSALKDRVSNVSAMSCANK